MPESSRAWAIASVGQSRASNDTISRGAIGMGGDLCLGSTARPWASIGAFENSIIAIGCCSSGELWPRWRGANRAGQTGQLQLIAKKTVFLKLPGLGWSIYYAFPGLDPGGRIPWQPKSFERITMKVVSSIGALKYRHADCQVVRRRGRIYVICKSNPRYKVRQGSAKVKRRKR